MSYNSRTSDVNLIFLLLCVVVALIVPGCNAACGFEDVQGCLSGIFGSSDINSFQCSESGRTCIDNLRRICAGSPTDSVISEAADLADYVCSTQGQNDRAAYDGCLTYVADTSGGTAKMKHFKNILQSCSNILTSLGPNHSPSTICMATKRCESYIVSTLNALCQNTAARRFFAKFADLVNVGGCFKQFDGGSEVSSSTAANITHISKLSMAVWAGLLTFFLTIN